ncbi:MAG: ATP synthase F1 subunit delta [Bryobacteraceae bacterium]|nr:ATP synthase F1 subunit delta [Bryobacteraceae bacterium]
MPQAVSQRYANALADAVLASGTATDPRQVSQELHSFGEMVRTVPELRTVFLSPAVSNARKRAVVDRFATTLPLSHFVRNFLFILIDRRRSAMLDEVAGAYDAVLDERLGVVRADVTSAVELSDAQRADLEGALSLAADKRVRCEWKVDESLIGGIVARIGSKVYDGSVRTQLQSLRQTLLS